MQRVQVAAMAVVTALVGCGDGGGSETSRDDLAEVQARVEAADHRGELREAGIYVSTLGGTTGGCVRVGLLNPTAPNVAYLRNRFGESVCVSREPSGFAEICSEPVLAPPARGPRRVPSIVGRTAESAQRVLAEAGLRWTGACLTDVERVPRTPDRLSPDALAVVSRQCPGPGERVRRGSVVALGLTYRLPGGMDVQGGALTDDYACADGRTP